MISKMKFVTMLGSIGEYDRIVSDYIMDSEIELEDPFVAFKSTPGFMPNTDKNPYEDAIKRFIEVFDYAGIDYSDIKTHKENFGTNEILEFIDGFDTQIHSLKSSLEAAQNEIAHYQLIEDTLAPIIGANVHIDDLVNMKYLKFRFGRLPVSSYKKLNDYLDGLPTYFAVMTTDKDYVWGFYFVSHQNSKKVDHVFSTLYFERIMIDGSEEGTPAEIVDKISMRNAECRHEIEELTIQINETVSRQKSELKRAFGCLKYYSKIQEIKKLSAHTKNTFYLTGWMTARDAAKLSSRTINDPDVSVVIDEPSAVKHITPPTKLRNPRFFKPFEEFVHMYGVPAYNELDPTPFLGIVYTLLFGMMFGDVGHGACLIIFGLVMIAMKKGSFLAKLLLPLGASSIIFGLLYGSVFGFESEHAIIRPLWYTPFENSQTMMNTLIMSVTLGVGVILICMCFNIINGIKQKDMQKIFFSQNGLAGIVFYVLVIICALTAVSGSKYPMTLAIVMIIISVVLIMLKEPLGKLAARQKDWKPKETGGFLVEAFFETFEIVLSFVTNTISFLRVGAFALNHAGMMSVVVMFMLKLSTGGSVAIAIFGNLLVIGLEGLVVGIQVLRLGFYEMFSRFYSGDGREFKPSDR